MKGYKRKFKIRIFDALIQNGIEYHIAENLVNYNEREALRLLNSVKRSKKDFYSKQHE